MTNEEINAENERIRQRAISDAEDQRVIPNSGHDPRDTRHFLYTSVYKDAGGKN